ncbi:A-kinase anchor protein 8-like [Platysternon megacephalum]|uniref:A-kinase anchor protein 8-like n=1 Tax=Platysternon megacephalum TaxID=55544 RepID=A0A4D9DLC4_9SAUR|nr:A-kinase anchor protein 8-like [Platysternon megacephalum]
MLIHEATHFLGTDDITHEEFPVDCRGLMVTTNSRSLDNANFVPLSGAVLNTNNIEYEFELTLNHKGKYENGQYSCCGETARNSVCEKAVPDEFFSSPSNQSLSISTDIDEILMKLLPARDRLQKHFPELREIADDIDKIHKGATIGNIAGGTAGIAGGITTIIGLCLAPVTFGASLIVSLTGLAVSTAGGLTSAAATTTDLVASKVKKETVEKLLRVCQAELEHIQDYTESITEKIQNLQDYENSGFVFAFSHIGSGAGRSVLNTIKMVKAGQLLANVGRIAKFAGAATGILTTVTLGLDVFFVARDSMELHKGAKTELAAKIREIVNEMERMIDQVNEMCTALTADKQE